LDIRSKLIHIYKIYKIFDLPHFSIPLFRKLTTTISFKIADEFPPSQPLNSSSLIFDLNGRWATKEDFAGIDLTVDAC